MAHQNALCAEHLRHFGQHRGAAVGNHVIREAAQHRVSGNAGKPVRPAALQAKLQFAQLARLALVVTHHLVQLVQLFNARFHFVVLVLTHHKVHALRVKFAQRVAEGVDLIVLAAEADHQHRARVRVAHHVLQHGTSIDVVVTQLGASIGVTEQMHTVGAFSIISLFQETRLNLTRDPVHAADSREDPQLIADPHLAAGAAVNLYLTIGRLSFFWLEVRLIAVLVQIAEIGAGIVGMNVFTRRNIRQRMTDGQTVLHHVLPFRDGDQGKLMSTSNGLA